VNTLIKQTDADATSLTVDTVQLIWLKWWDRKSTRDLLGLITEDAMDMGMVNAVIPHAELEDTAYNGHRHSKNHQWLSKC
jgi:naphthoate synthase